MHAHKILIIVVSCACIKVSVSGHLKCCCVLCSEIVLCRHFVCSPYIHCRQLTV